MATYRIQRLYSKPDNREDASQEVIEKAKKDGVVQKIDGSWRIVAIKKGKLWRAKFQSKEKALNSLRYYHQNIK